MLTLPFLFLACILASPAAASPTRTTPVARDVFGDGGVAAVTVDAVPCSSAAPFACDGSDAFCCAESTQCLPVGGAAPSWVCRVGRGIANAFSCGASDTACADGVTCCPEDMACAPGGGCVSTDLDLGGDEDDPRAQTEQCDDGETLCVNVCCTEEEACDAKTGMCMLASAEPKDAALPAPPAGPALVDGGHEYEPPSGMFSDKHKNTTAALNGTAASHNGTAAAHNSTAASLKGAAETGLNRTPSAALNRTSAALPMNKTSAALNGTELSPANNRTSAVVANATASEEGSAAVNAAVAHVPEWGVPIVTVGVSLSVVALSVLCMDR